LHCSRSAALQAVSGSPPVGMLCVTPRWDRSIPGVSLRLPEGGGVLFQPPCRRCTRFKQDRHTVDIGPPFRTVDRAHRTRFRECQGVIGIYFMPSFNPHPEVHRTAMPRRVRNWPCFEALRSAKHLSMRDGARGHRKLLLRPLPLLPCPLPLHILRNRSLDQRVESCCHRFCCTPCMI
jgi:hypothetical protein